jgi:ribosomal-protein-alanine acetyltransferase
MTVRPAKPGDVARILEIERAASTAAHWKEEDYAAILARAGSTRADANPAGARRVVLVAEERGRVLGFMVAQAATVEWEIENVVVEAQARRRRLASRMIERLLDIATSRNAISVSLEVRESNAAARALYANAGFAQVGHRAKYYSNPEEDAVIYRFNLR